MNRIEYALRTTILILALGVVSCGTRTPATQAESFEFIDADGNEKIDVDEFAEAVCSTAFGEMDTDANGSLDAKEWSRTEKDKTAANRFSETDANKDGVLSYEEFSGLKRKKTTLKNLFSTLDQNGDGILKIEDLEKDSSN